MEYVVRDSDNDNYKSHMIEVVQSWILTTSRYDFDVYEKRIVYRIVEMTQQLLQGQRLNQHFRIDKNLFDLYDVEIPLVALLQGEEDHNHTRVKNSLRKMADKKLEYEDDVVWKLIPIISHPVIEKRKNTVKFKLHEDIYSALLNFSKGFKKYELKTVFEFESVYAMRFYELFSNQRTPLMFSINDLKLMFGLDKKYKKPNDFIKRVVERAKRVLDEKSPYSFEYTTLKKGKNIISIKFYPVQRPENVTDEYKQFLNEQAKKQLSPAWVLERQISTYLKEHYMFTTTEIKNNIGLFEQAQKEIPDLLMFLSEVKAKANRATNSKGYLINALRKKMNIKADTKEKKPTSRK